MKSRVAASVFLGVLISCACAARAAQGGGPYRIRVDGDRVFAGRFATGMTEAQLRQAAGSYDGAALHVDWQAPQAEEAPGNLSVTLKSAEGGILLEFIFQEGDYIPEKKILVDDPGIAAIRVFDQRFETEAGLRAGMSLEQAAALGEFEAQLYMLGGPGEPYLAFDEMPCVLAMPDLETWSEEHGNILEEYAREYDSVIPVRELPEPGAVPIASLMLNCAW